MSAGYCRDCGVVLYLQGERRCRWCRHRNRNDEMECPEGAEFKHCRRWHRGVVFLPACDCGHLLNRKTMHHEWECYWCDEMKKK